MNSILFERVVELCKEKGISQRKLQEEVNMSTGALSKWKTSTPNVTLLQKVADYFGVTTDYLTGKTKYRNREHMLQSFDKNVDLNKLFVADTEIPYGQCIQTDEGIVPKYIDPETRMIAEKLEANQRLKDMMEVLENMDSKSFDAVYQIVMSLDKK